MVSGTVAEVLLQLRQRLAHAGIDSAAFEAAELMCDVLGISRTQLPLKMDEPVASEQAAQLDELAARRLAGEPLQYLLGQWEFFGLPFEVGQGVLIPRPDTELLVELTLERLPETGTLSLLDLCSGSGCVAVALACSREGAAVTAVERSPEAFAYLTRNIARNAAAVTPVCADLFEWQPHGTFDAIVSNPPYIPTHQLPGLQREVQREPAMALDGGEDGLVFYRAICTRCLPWLRPGGWLLCEIGFDQGAAVRALFEGAGLADVQVHQDLGGNDRVVLGRRV